MKTINLNCGGDFMKNYPKSNVVTLAEHRLFEKNEISFEWKEDESGTEKESDLMETLFRLLGDKRSAVISYIRMKLGRQRRLFFKEEIKQCQSIKDECQCVRKFFRQLKTNDAMALLMSMPVMLAERIETGQFSDNKRFEKLIECIGLAKSDVNLCILFWMFTRYENDRESIYAMGI
jgi:ribosomal protein S24E